MYWWMVLDSNDNYDWDDFRHSVRQVALIWAKDEKEAGKTAGKWGIDKQSQDFAGRYKTIKDAKKSWKGNQKDNEPHRHNDIDFAVKDGKMMKGNKMNESKSGESKFKIKTSRSVRGGGIDRWTVILKNRARTDTIPQKSFKSEKEAQSYMKKMDKKYPVNEGYKMHYPSLKKLTQLSYTDPRIATEGKTIFVEKEGNFRNRGENVDGHYVVYEDKGMPGSYIGVHISSDLSEDTGEANVSVVAMDSSKSAVMNRVAYRMRQSKIVEASVELSEAKVDPDHKKVFQGWVKEIRKNIANNPKYAKSLALEKDQEKTLMVAMMRIIQIMGNPGTPAHSKLKPVLPKKYDETLVSNGDKNTYDSPWWSMTDAQKNTIIKKGLK